MIDNRSCPVAVRTWSVTRFLVAALMFSQLCGPAAADELTAPAPTAAEPATTPADPTAPDPPAEEPLLYEATVEDGTVFLNGHYLAPPYLIRATQNHATINGKPIPVSRYAAIPAEFGGPPHEYAPRSGMRTVPSERPQRGSTDNSATEQPDEPASGEDTATGERRRNAGPNGERNNAERPNRQRERGEGERGNRERPRVDRESGEFEIEYGSGEREPTPWEERGLRRERAPVGSMARWTARQLVYALENQTLVVMFDNLPMRVINNPSDIEMVYATLMIESPTPADREQFIAFAYPPRAVARWNTWLDEFTPDAETQAVMQKVLDERDAILVENMRQINATRRLDTLAYPLTIVGMILSVVAFGHLLQWMGKGLAQNDENASVGAKHVVVSLGLMLGMALIDFVWTVLAGQAGVMREVNPLAAKFLNSPSQLAMFKVLATLTGFGILFVWRRRYQIQHATWWLCLACVLVTFRWVVFDSMLN